MQTQLPPDCESFAAAFEAFTSTCQWLLAEQQARSGHGAIESQVLAQSREIGRRLVQGFCDHMAAKDKLAGRPEEADPSAHPHDLPRNLHTVMGTVRIHRTGWQCTGKVTVIPLNKILDLPRELYSHGVQRFVVEQAETMSYDRSGLALVTFGLDVPKRQREQSAMRMARDFHAFYERQPRSAANDTTTQKTLLVMSADGVGVKVVHASLREDTRKHADLAEEAFLALGSVKGDPMEPRVGHTHGTRMATVTMNWDQEPMPRTAEEILEQFKPAAAREIPRRELPRPMNRRVRATLERSQQEAIAEMFAEAERRDPSHERRWVVLLDGSNSQRDQVLAEAKRRGVKVTIVTDLLHVLHYLWKCGKALYGGTTTGADEWVQEVVGSLLRGPASSVISTLKAKADEKGEKKVSARARKALRACVQYLSHNEVGLDYAEALAVGMPIATGNIEGACRHLVRDRMDITGARWTTEGAEAILRIRALLKSGDWEEYCTFHFQEEHNRVYPPAKVKEAA